MKALSAGRDSSPGKPHGPIRVAFLAPGFVDPTGGNGPGTYLHRIAFALRDEGHDVELFVRSLKRSGTMDFYGIKVHHVLADETCVGRLLMGLSRRVPFLAESVKDLAGAHALGKAFRTRDAIARFDLVQTSDWGITGLFVSRAKSRRVLARCCSARDLFRAAERESATLDQRLLEVLEIASIRRAHRIYAPSHVIAHHLSTKHSLDVKVIPPPAVQERRAADAIPPLPNQFLIHFGWLGYRKGTDLVAQALKVLQQEAPDARVVFVGGDIATPILDDLVERLAFPNLRDWWLGPLDKPELYAVLRRATASVLPSRSDNLPNTVIESLLNQVPVIGTVGSSIEELVEPGITGDLVPADDPVALAHMMLDYWNGTRRWRGPSTTLIAMTPSAAAAKLLEFAGLHREGSGKPSSHQIHTPRIIRLHPASSVAGRAFNEQPDGRSAIAVESAGAQMFTRVVFDGVELPSHVGSDSLVTALVPKHLYEKPRSVEVRLRDELAGESTALPFEIARDDAPPEMI